MILSIFSSNRSTITALLCGLAIFLVGKGIENVRVQENNYNEYKTGIHRDDMFVVKAHMSAANFDVVVMGDSRTVHGISPDDVELGLDHKLRVGNAGYDSLGLNRDMCLVGAGYLRPQTKKPVLVFAVTPLALTQLNARNELYLQVINKSRSQVFLIYFSSVRRFFEPISFFRISEIIKDVFVPAGKKFESDYPTWHWVPTSPNLVHVNGWHEVLFPKRRFRDEQLVYYQNIFDTNKVDQQVENEFMTCAGELISRGIVVYAFRMRPSPPILEIEDRKSGFDEQSFAARFKSLGGQWLDFDFSSFSHADGSHLDPISARALSRQIGQRLLRDGL